MKTIIIAVLFVSLGITGVSIAQSTIDKAEKHKRVTVVTIQCDDQSTDRRCLNLPTPPQPPQPPQLPQLPQPPQPPSVPALPQLPELPELPELPPPPPPEVPKITIPNELHAMCKDKPVGSEVRWQQDSHTKISGTCSKRAGEMRFEVERIVVRK